MNFIPQLWANELTKRIEQVTDWSLYDALILWYDAIPMDERVHDKGFHDLSMQCCLF